MTEQSPKMLVWFFLQERDRNLEEDMWLTKSTFTAIRSVLVNGNTYKFSQTKFTLHKSVILPNDIQLPKKGYKEKNLRKSVAVRPKSTKIWKKQTQL